MNTKIKRIRAADNHNIAIKIYRKVPASFQKQVGRLSNMCFDKKGTLKEQAEQDDKFCSGDDRFAIVLVRKNRQVIGQIVVLKREINFNGKKVFLGGIGGVCVQENKRGQGIATAMLKVAMEELKKAGCDVAYLCANPEKGPKLYGPFGFVFLKKKYTYQGKSGKRYFEDYGMVAPINSRVIFEEIMTDKEPFDIGVGNW